MTTAVSPLTLDVLQAAVGSGGGAAFRRITRLMPAGGPGDKVFPPTYEGGKYAVENRVFDGGEPVDCVLLDSVQSQANRMELALLEAVRSGSIELPLLTVRFDDPRLRKRFTVTSLEAPHRMADALLRDSLCDGVVFRKSPKGRVLDDADLGNATGLFGLNPTALLLGLWDSTGPRGGLGVKFQRALVSEIVGIDVVQGGKTSSRIDPAQIAAQATIYAADSDIGYTLDPAQALRDAKGNPKLFDRGRGEGKAGNPSKANHSNIPPQFKLDGGGCTIARAQQTTVLSLPVLRRLRFPEGGNANSTAARDIAARTTLAALGLLGATLAADAGADLRSRCLLVPTEPFVWQLLGQAGQQPQEYSLDGQAAVQLFTAALAQARAADLPWEGEIALTPSEELTQLVARSQELSAAQPEGGA